MTTPVAKLAWVAQKGQRSPKADALSFFFIVLFCTVWSFVFPTYGIAEETETHITSESLEYFGETKHYVAKGSVEVKQKDAVITADEITYDENNSDVFAEGRVFYHDADTSMEARKAAFNLESKTGTLFDADIFYVKDNYYLSGGEIEKTGENSYYSPSAAFTTCDAPVPAWCFRGKNVNVILGERLRAKGATFRIKNVPVLYSPYVWAPILTKRQTGFLMPVVSQSDKRGFGLHIPFFWAISENRDATFIFDSYSKIGIGEGMEYRFVEPGGVKGYAWAYHISDSEADKDYWELKGLYENRSPGGAGVFLNVNILNEKDFYREFSQQLQARTQRYLESTGELNVPSKNSRFYLLSQYWIDLKNNTADVAQKLPEAGYVLNYTKFGSSLISNSLTVANMWRDGGLSAGRIDLYPKLLHSFGRDFVVSQTGALRATGYSFYHDDSVGSSTLRTAFEYDVVGHTRLYRKYDSFLHVLEPSLGYRFVATSDNDLPVFDVTEAYKKASLIEFSLLNRFISGGSEAATVRLTQGMDTYNGDRPFLPLKLDVAITKGIPIKLSALYNVQDGRLETANSELLMSIAQVHAVLGLTYDRSENIMLYKAGLQFSPLKNIHVVSNIWYDAKGAGLRDLSVTMRYQRQCWGLRFEMIKKPDDFTTRVMVELAGLNSERVKAGETAKDSDALLKEW
jgi:LPS-assembly protein